MAQFDVYVNLSPATRTAFPYFVDVQNEILSDIATRVVIPLGHLNNFNNEDLKVITPVVNYKEQVFLLLTPQLASVPKSLLKKPIGSLLEMRDEIIYALDFLVTGV